jgi:hypothetical protein
MGPAVQALLPDQITRTTQAKNLFCTLSILVTLGILFATLRPFNPFPTNQVNWLTGSNGIRIGKAGVVLSPRALASQGALTLGGPSSLEIWLRPFETKSVYTVLDFYESGNPLRFRLRQYHDGLIVSRDSRGVDGRLKRVKVDLDHGLKQGKLTLITLTSGDKGTSLYLDGRLKETYANFQLTAGDMSGQIVLGTAAGDSEPWTGEIHGLAIYSKHLTATEVLAHYESWTQDKALKAAEAVGTVARYPFDEQSGHTIHSEVSGGMDLEIPKRFQVPHKAFLTLPWNEFDWSRSYLDDLLRNIAGFVPFGFVVGAYFSLTRYCRRFVWSTILSGATLSLCIEVLQAYIPQRSSGTTDILTNTLGTALGVALLRSAPVKKLLVQGWT